MTEPGFCSKCGGELDSEGWCARYCMDDDPFTRDRTDVVRSHPFGVWPLPTSSKPEPRDP